MASRTENLLIKDVEALGYEAMRSPGSGSRPEHDAGDVWIAEEVISKHGRRATHVYIVEEKYKTSTPRIYEDGDKLDAMIRMADAIGAIPLFASRWSTQKISEAKKATHWIADARTVPRTDSGNAAVKLSDAQEQYATTEEFFTSV